MTLKDRRSEIWLIESVSKIEWYLFMIMVSSIVHSIVIIGILAGWWKQ